MLSTRIASSALVALTLIVAVPATPAVAGTASPVDCEQNPTAAECTIQVGVPGDRGEPGRSGGSACHDPAGRVVACFVPERGWLGADGCYYRLVDAATLAQFPLLFPDPVAPGRWYEGSCGDPRINFWPLTRYRVLDTPPGPALLAREAVRRLRLTAPTIRVNPAPPAPQLVFVPTWLWLDASSWGARSATASVPGLSVTATATPVSVTWLTGDGASVTCQGRGTPWSGGDPMAASPDCGHTYTRHSGAGMFTVRATITWNVTWVGGGTSGTEPALTSTATADIRVAESPTVITAGA